MASWSADGQRVGVLPLQGPTLNGRKLTAPHGWPTGAGKRRCWWTNATRPQDLSPSPGRPGHRTGGTWRTWSRPGPRRSHLGNPRCSSPTGRRSRSWCAAALIPGQDFSFRLSPDGRWLAYTSTESGREETYVTHLPSGSGKWQVSQSGGLSPPGEGTARNLLPGIRQQMPLWLSNRRQRERQQRSFCIGPGYGRCSRCPTPHRSETHMTVTPMGSVYSGHIPRKRVDAAGLGDELDGGAEEVTLARWYRSGLTESLGRWARAAWAKSIVPTTRASTHGSIKVLPATLSADSFFAAAPSEREAKSGLPAHTSAHLHPA